VQTPSRVRAGLSTAPEQQRVSSARRMRRAAAPDCGHDHAAAASKSAAAASAGARAPPQRSTSSSGASSSNASSNGGERDAGGSRATDLVLHFYSCYNSNDVEGLMECFAEGVVYHDMIYLEPFFGKRALEAYFREFSSFEGLQQFNFEVKDIVGDDSSCGVAWCAACPHSAVSKGMPHTCLRSLAPSSLRAVRQVRWRQRTDCRCSCHKTALCSISSRMHFPQARRQLKADGGVIPFVLGCPPVVCHKVQGCNLLHA
jgi:SnoaL-like domain